MVRLIREDEKLKIINFGALGYGEELCCSILGWSTQEEVSACQSPEFLDLYKRGKDTSSYVIDLKLFEMAQAGDIKALNKLEQRKRKYLK